MSDSTAPIEAEPLALGDATELTSGGAEPKQTQPRVSIAAAIVADILAGLAQAQPAIFAASRASARTQAQVSLVLALAGVVAGAFLRRRP